MKYSKIVLTNLLTILTMNASVTFAGGFGTGGGAVGYNLDGTVVIADLNDPTICQWKSGTSFLSSLRPSTYGLLSNVLSSIKNINPYLSAKLKKEIEMINWCSTIDLKKIETNDKDSVVVPYEGTQRRQVAVRFIDEKKVFLDKVDFSKMDDLTQVFTVLHESMHSFIPKDTEQRNNKLRAIVAALKQQYENKISEDDFDTALDMSDIVGRLSASQSKVYMDLVKNIKHLAYNEEQKQFIKTQYDKNKEFFTHDIEFIPQHYLDYLVYSMGYADFIADESLTTLIKSTSGKKYLTCKIKKSGPFSWSSNKSRRINGDSDHAYYFVVKKSSSGSHTISEDFIVEYTYEDSFDKNAYASAMKFLIGEIRAGKCNL